MRILKPLLCVREVKALPEVKHLPVSPGLPKAMGRHLVRSVSGILVGSLLMFGLFPALVVAQESNVPAAANLRIEVARANLELAEVELKLAEDFNREVEGVLMANVPKEDRDSYIRLRSVPDVIIERLRANVEIARQQVEHALMPSTGDVEKIRKKYAEQKIRLAEVNLNSLRNLRSKGLPVKEDELKRQELRLQLARLNRQLLDSPENLLEIVDSLQRQVDRLNEELIRQDQRLSALEDGGK